MSWLHPSYLALLAAVAALAGLFAWAAYRRRRTFGRLGTVPLIRRLAGGVSARRRRYKAALVVLGVSLLALALAGPRYGTQVREVEREGADLIIALDVSQSMLAEDVAPSRLERAKREIGTLLGELRGDRVGLVIFAGDAFLQCPLTSDYSAVRLFLDVASPALMPSQGTDFSAALRVAREAFETPLSEDDAGDRTRALLFVSDGENHVSGIEALVEEAREAGIHLFAAGVGETTGAPIPVYDDGRRVGFKEDRSGRVVTTRLEEEALRALGGTDGYFRVARTSSGLPRLHGALLKNEQDVHLFERLAFLARRQGG